MSAFSTSNCESLDFKFTKLILSIIPDLKSLFIISSKVFRELLTSSTSKRISSFALSVKYFAKPSAIEITASFISPYKVVPLSRKESTA